MLALVPAAAALLAAALVAAPSPQPPASGPPQRKAASPQDQISSPPLRGGEGVQGGAAPPAPPRQVPPAADWKVPLAHAGGVLLGMRLAVSVAWPEAYDPTRFASERDQLRLAFTRPPDYRRDRPLLESDGDPWWVNGLGHAAFGSEIYGRTRQCGGGPVAALLAAAATSVAWEYGLEAPHKRPSAVDLVWTPLAGAIVGEGRYRLHRWLRARNASAWLLFAVDPLGESERRVFRTRC